MSDQRYHGELSVAFLEDPSGWNAIQAAENAVRDFVARNGGATERWRAEYLATTFDGAFGTGGSIDELREAWTRNHLELGHFSLTLFGRQASGPIGYVSLGLIPKAKRHGNEWGGSIVLMGPTLIGVNTFAVDLATEMQRSLRARFRTGEVVALRTTAVVQPQRVPVGQPREAPLAGPANTLLERVREMVERSGAGVVTALPRAVHTPVKVEEATGAPEVGRAEASSSARGTARAASVEKKARWLVRVARETSVQLVAGAIGAIVLAVLGAWHFIPR